MVMMMIVMMEITQEKKVMMIIMMMMIVMRMMIVMKAIMLRMTAVYVHKDIFLFLYVYMCMCASYLCTMQVSRMWRIYSSHVQPVQLTGQDVMHVVALMHFAVLSDYFMRFLGREWEGSLEVLGCSIVFVMLGD